ncbi:hypothetical protein ACFE04_002031 [Oxalis oulophora]
MKIHQMNFVFAFVSSLVVVVFSTTDPGDLAIINNFRKNLKNPDVLKWPAIGDDNDPCGPPSWPHIFCSDSRVTQIQVQNMGLEGPLPHNLNQLTMLSNVGFQKNMFSGQLPSFSGLANLEYAYLDLNNFDSIPADFFDGLTSLQVLALDYNNFNASTGWSFPKALLDSTLLANLSCMSCNLAGPLPDFLGSISSLQFLMLSENHLSGEIPASFKGMPLQMLWLNDQKGGGGLSGTIDVAATMESLTTLRLQGNKFTGTIPDTIGDLVSLKDFNLNGNQLSGLIPDSLADLPLENLDLSNNHFMGSIPKFSATTVTYKSNSFCQSKPGLACAPEVTALIEFLEGLNYPLRLLNSWSGNNPCNSWLGVSCNPTNQEVSVINLPNYHLSGKLSPSLAKLPSLSKLKLQSNNLTGSIPKDWTSLKSLSLIDVSNNNISPPLPEFSSQVHIVLNGNPLLTTPAPAPETVFPHINSTAPVGSKSPPATPPATPSSLRSPINGPKSGKPVQSAVPVKSKQSALVPMIVVVAIVAVIALLAIILLIQCCKKRKDAYLAPSSLVVYPRDSSDPDNTVKIVVANSNTNGSTSTLNGSDYASRNSSGIGQPQVIESGNLVISVQVLQNVTKNFAPENELGRGGFGVVYKGQLDDGTNIAVKRMESSVITNKALDEFQAEIAVLSKVRHRHLVSLLGYSIEGSERLLVYEYLPQGALSRHLFHWKSFKLEPLSWKRRLNIALDVARGMEYLHTLAHQSFIHRDLKSSNILLGDDFRAKVADFGLVKLAPNGEKSVVTRLAGTFGYLAPEYAVTGKITTKADVFSFGVVLMEILTGLTALDDDRPEESQYLAAWFWHIKSDQETLRAAVDPSLDLKDDETFKSISMVAELAGHCTAREPSQRPDMGHAVNVLAPLVEKWKPTDEDAEDFCGIDYSLPLTQMVKGWQEAEGKDISYVDLEDSKGSIPARPAGFADSFTSADGR